MDAAFRCGLVDRLSHSFDTPAPLSRYQHFYCFGATLSIPLFSVLCDSRLAQDIAGQLRNYSLYRSTMACLTVVSSSSASRQRGVASISFCQRPQHARQSTYQPEVQHSMRVVSSRALGDSLRSSGSSHLDGLGGILGGGAKLRSSYDVVGLGEAMVDYSGMVSEEYLEQRGIERGGRRYVAGRCGSMVAASRSRLAVTQVKIVYDLHK